MFSVLQKFQIVRRDRKNSQTHFATTLCTVTYIYMGNIAIKSHLKLGCKSVARTDFILSSKNNRIYYLETNTQPGLTSISLLPEQAKYRNISFQNIVMGLINNTN